MKFILDLNALIKYESGDKTHKIRHERPKSTEREKENKFPDRKFKSKSATAIPITHDANTQTQTINMPLIPTIRKSPAKQNLQKKPNEQNIEKNSEKKIPTKRKCVRNTPVDLYQKYKMDWEKFRNFIPGENKRVTVRNTMRDKMRVKPLPKPDVSFRQNNKTTQFLEEKKNRNVVFNELMKIHSRKISNMFFISE